MLKISICNSIEIAERSRYSRCHRNSELVGRTTILTRWVALMIQLEQQQHEEFVCGVVGGGWLTPTTYIQLAGAGSIN